MFQPDHSQQDQPALFLQACLTTTYFQNAGFPLFNVPSPKAGEKSSRISQDPLVYHPPGFRPDTMRSIVPIALRSTLIAVPAPG